MCKCLDAAFAQVWRWMRKNKVTNIHHYSEGVEKAFNSSKRRLKASAVDMYVLPDYVAWLDGFLDKKLSNYAKVINTQHQWRFEAVQRSVLFPFGCKTTYRAYSSGKVVEIIKKPMIQCITPIGMLTGLEAYTTYCKWYPDQNSIPNRNVEGFYILTDMPYIGRNHRGIIKHLEPAEFSSDTKNAILNLMGAVYDLWDESDPIRKDWIKWHEEHRLDVNDVRSYVDFDNDRLHISLLHIFSPEYSYQCKWETDLPKTSFSEVEMEWPHELYAIAMPCVHSSFQSSCPPSRVYGTNDNVVKAELDSFDLKTADYYSRMDAVSNEALVGILKRRTNSKGEYLSSYSGSKVKLISNVKKLDRDFRAILYRTLIPENMYFVHQTLYAPIRGNMALNEVVVDITVKNVSRKLALQ